MYANYDFYLNVKYQCLKLKEALRNVIMLAISPVIVSQCYISFNLCADVVRQMCAKKGE